MEHLMENYEYLREECRGYQTNFAPPGTGERCPQIIAKIMQEDFGDDPFEKGYRSSFDNYLAALVRKCINIAETGRKILSSLPPSQPEGRHRYSLVIESNPEMIKTPFLLSPPVGPQDAGFINDRFRNIEDRLLSEIKFILKDRKDKDKDKIFTDFSDILVKYNYPPLKNNTENEFIASILFIYRQTAWAAAVADYFAEKLKRVILYTVQSPVPKNYRIPVPKELPWLPDRDTVLNFELGIDQEIELRDYLESKNIKENDLVFFISSDEKHIIMTYFMDADLGNNFRGFNKEFLMPRHFYEFLGRMGLTRRVAENLYDMGHIIKPEPGYWPPQITKKRIL